MKVEPADKKLRRYIYIQSTATCSQNEQQQDGKNNVELQVELMKATWKTFAETIRRGRNRSLKA